MKFQRFSKVLVLLLAVNFATFAQQIPRQGTLAWLDYKHGFKELKLDSRLTVNPVSLLQVKLKSAGENEVDYIYRNLNGLNIDTCICTTALVTTFKDRTSMIILNYSTSAFSRIREMFTLAYGEPTVDKVGECSWIGNEILCGVSTKSDHILVTFMSLDSFRQKEEDDKAKARAF